MKYEAVFGDQSLFDGLMTDCEFASEEYGYSFANGRLYYCERYNEKAGWSLSCKSHLTFKPSAMRRIIRTPKRWTVEDQKAGKLPEVGSRIYVPIMLGEQTVIYSSEKVIVSISDNEGAVTRTEVRSIDRIKPIESPEEKAARLRKEWCVAASKQLKNLEYNSTLTSIYDALLSGDLPVPGKGE